MKRVTSKPLMTTIIIYLRLNVFISLQVGEADANPSPIYGILEIVRGPTEGHCRYKNKLFPLQNICLLIYSPCVHRHSSSLIQRTVGVRQAWVYMLQKC